MITDEDFKKILMDHEGRIARLEADVNNMSKWMSKIDKKLDSLTKNMEYLRGELKNTLNDNNGVSKKQYWSLIVALITNMGILIMILFKVFERL